MIFREYVNEPPGSIKGGELLEQFKSDSAWRVYVQCFNILWAYTQTANLHIIIYTHIHDVYMYV
jgi:hypothetical protein